MDLVIVTLTLDVWNILMTKENLRLITSIEEFKALEYEWNNVYDQSDRCSVFSSWDWLFTWWEVFHKKGNRELFIICLYEQDKLVGIAPLQIEKSYPISFLQGKTLRFIGSSSKNEIMTELSDFIVKKEYEIKFVNAVTHYLKENKKYWDFADFEFLQEDSLVLGCFNNADEKVYGQKIQYGVRYLIPEMTSIDDYLNLISSRRRKDFNRINRVLERDGGSSLKTIEKQEEIKPIFDRLADMHRERWEGKIDTCVFDMPEFKEFHLKILERLVPKGKANITTLMVNDEAQSSIYSFEDKGQVHYYQSGFFNENRNKYSPLFVLVCMLVGKASENKKRFDFMFDEDPESYKGHQYKAEGKTMYRLKLTPQPLRLIVFKHIQNFVRTCRSTKSYLGNMLIAKHH